MATIETMAVKYKKKVFVDRCFNVSEPVGVGQPNKIGDVMVIQALITLAAQSYFRQSLPDDGEDLPLVTGIFTDKTRKFIWEFQTHFMNGSLKADGIVHPASLRGRKMRSDRSLMTIVQLNRYANAAAPIDRYYGDHTLAILDMYPLLKVLVADLTKQSVLVA